MSVITVTQDNFEAEVMQADKPVLLDFWASWCGPCKMQAPIIDALANEDDSIKCCKINVDEEADLAAKFGVMSIPSLFAVINGAVVNSAVGVQSKEALKALFD